jgi:predicted PurR-regulated permease PerM
MEQHSLETSDDLTSTPPISQAARIFAWSLLLGLGYLIWASREALAPLLFAALLIYIMLPAVRWIEQHLPQRLHATRRRGIAVAITMVASVAGLIVLINAFLDPVVDQTRDMLMDFDLYWDSIRSENPDFEAWYQETIPSDWQLWIDSHMTQIGMEFWQWIGSATRWLLGITGSLLSAILALVSIPLFLINYLLDERRTSTNLRRQFPSPWATEGIALYRIFDTVFGTYTRGVILEAVIVGFITGLGYWIIGIDLFVPLAVIAVIGEIVPIVGPWLAFFVSFPVILATQPELTIPAIAVFLVIQALEGWFLAPAIQASSNDFTNAGILVILAIGGAVAGALGVIFALPAAALLRALSIYVFHRLNGMPSAEALTTVERHRQRDKGRPPVAEAPDSPDPATA